MTPPGTPSEPPAPSEEPTSQPLALQLDLPATETETAGALPAAAHPTAPRARGLWLAAACVLLGGIAFAALVTRWFLPWYVRRACVAAAASRGIALSIEEARIDPSGFRLVGVHAACPAIAALQAQASEVDVEATRFRVSKVTVHGAEVTLRGSPSAVESDLTKWMAAQTDDKDGGWTLASLAIDGGHFVWQAALGDAVRVEAADTHVDMAWRPTLELRARSNRVAVVTPGGPLGPWGVDIDLLPKSSRARIALDPAVPESCTVLVVGDGARASSIDVVIPRSPLAHLGVADALVGANGAGLQLESSLHYVTLGPQRADASARGGLYGVPVSGLPRPIDIAWDAIATGNPTTGIDVKRARLAVGPLVGAVTGTLRRFDEGFRVDLAWAAGPVPCAAFVVPLGLGQPFDIAYVLRTMAGPNPVGPRRLHRGSAADGGVSATVMFSFDSRDLGSTRLEFAPDIDCGGAF
jgi:hypothetical protein